MRKVHKASVARPRGHGLAAIQNMSIIRTASKGARISFCTLVRAGSSTILISRFRACAGPARQFVQVQAASQETGAPKDAFAPGKEGEVRQVLFNRISPVYDQLNDLLSLGQHRVWKAMAVKWSKAKPGQTVLDVCCGTGDLAFLLARAVGPSGKVGCEEGH